MVFRKSKRALSIFLKKSNPRDLNPRLVWCYAGEDLMGKMRPVCAASTRGNSMWGMSEKALNRYLQALDMALRDPAQWLKTCANWQL